MPGPTPLTYRELASSKMVVEKPDYRHRHLLPTRGDRPIVAPPRSVMKSRRFNRSNCIRPPPRPEQECRISDRRGSVSGYCKVLQPISGPKVCFGSAHGRPLQRSSILPQIASELYSTNQISECVFTQRGSDSAVRASLPHVRTPQNRDISKLGLFQSSAGKLSPILPFLWYARGISLEQRKRNG